jgi:hypothetical protein
LETSQLLWGLLFSMIGVGFFMYGKRQKALAPLLCALGLMIYPYFISNSYVLVIIGVALIAIPYFMSI